MTIDDLPKVNAFFNGVSTVLLITGFALIRARKWRAHAGVMIAALASSSIFLAGYLVHKAFRPDIRIASRFPHLGDGWRYTYWFAILGPHLLLAVAMLPLIGAGLWFAWKRNWVWHRRINRWTLPIWLYVSVTGVLIYWLLYHFFPALNARSA